MYHVANAGNDAREGKVYGYPASCPEVLSVAAVDRNKQWADFSNYNEEVDIAGPGVDVNSTLPVSEYGLMSGTSMATPHVSAVAAQIWGNNPTATAAQVGGGGHGGGKLVAGWLV